MTLRPLFRAEPRADQSNTNAYFDVAESRHRGAEVPETEG